MAGDVALEAGTESFLRVWKKRFADGSINQLTARIETTFPTFPQKFKKARGRSVGHRQDQCHSDQNGSPPSSQPNSETTLQSHSARSKTKPFTHFWPPLTFSPSLSRWVGYRDAVLQ
ncbi:hypothetical protein PGT21_029372 [Puccinia graminis f. sp. tritici]|uniref:Uncharacterized protein n=1 Tax=Puccinia graminis f. sp. tritici TaxID=56615 RepID=A0A5B0N8M3_PUCGR|nr:hypothetical protein PGT21_029372 [Puccinia graminis f. sp. tritici]KAA1133041.1 hypothetical protein PGTUg99_025346 [Puccinia graminis f. sp. tritici]